MSPNILKRLTKVNVYENPSSALNSLLTPNATINYEFISETGQPHEKVFEMKLTFKHQDMGHSNQQDAVVEKEFIGVGMTTSNTHYIFKIFVCFTGCVF